MLGRKTPQVNYYQVIIEVAFKITGSISHHEAVQAAEGRVNKSLKNDGPSFFDLVKSAKIVSASATDESFYPPRTGGK